MRYLMTEQLRANLSLGRYVEQWLPPRHYDNYTAIRYVTLQKNKDLLYEVNYWEHFDDGDENSIDVYDFSYLNPDEPGVLNNFDSIDDTLNFVNVTYNATPDKFVNFGMIQDIYKDYVMSGRKN